MRWFWTFWIVGLVGGVFAIGEGYALMHDKTTLSRFVWEISQAFPPFPYLAGFVSGFLACHFWWGGIVRFDPVKRPEDQP